MSAADTWPCCVHCEHNYFDERQDHHMFPCHTPGCQDDEGDEDKGGVYPDSEAEMDALAWQRGDDERDGAE